MKSIFKNNFAGLALLCVFSFILLSFTIADEPWNIPAKYKALKNPTKADKENLAVGKSLFDKHCKSCHGKNGIGDGIKADDLDTDMPDLTTSTYKEQKPGVKYYKSFVGKGEMPNFEKKITDDEDRWFVINYMETFK